MLEHVINVVYKLNITVAFVEAVMGLAAEWGRLHDVSISDSPDRAGIRVLQIEKTKKRCKWLLI